MQKLREQAAADKSREALKKKVMEAVLPIEDCLKICREQNGLLYCKNCGLDNEVPQNLKKIFEEK